MLVPSLIMLNVVLSEDEYVPFSLMLKMASETIIIVKFNFAAVIESPVT
jgi:hypothetical protein